MPQRGSWFLATEQICLNASWKVQETEDSCGALLGAPVAQLGGGYSDLVCRRACLRLRGLSLCRVPPTLSLFAGMLCPWKGHSIPRAGMSGSNPTCSPSLPGKFISPLDLDVSMCQVEAMTAPTT